jgi:FKBP-type peptidyl-prolyl cis-trans isomerase FkpA
MIKNFERTIHFGTLCYRNLLGILVSILFLSSCGNDAVVPPPENPDNYKKPLENVNKELVEKENAQIESYIARYQWDMKKTGTGLRYLIYEEGKGSKADTGMRVEIRFKVNLINGVVVYDSKTDGMKTFMLGKAEVESGLEEGILLMKTGDKAKLIIPSHLAFGLLGDENKIPKRATLVYDVELVSVYR